MSDKDTAAADAAKPEKQVKIKIMRDCMANGDIRKPGTVLTVSESVAKELCDTKFSGYHPFYGTMPEIGPLMGDEPNPLDRKEIVRAVRVA